MANYDAEVRVSTKVDTSQMQKLQSQIDNAVNNVDRLTKYLEKLNNTKLPTERYVALSAQIKETQSRLERFQEKQKYLSDYGNEATPAYSRVSKQIADAESSLSVMRSEMQALVDSGKAFRLDDEEIRKITEELVKAKSELHSLVSKQDEMRKKNIKVSDGLHDISAGLKKVGNLGVRAFSKMNRHVNRTGGLLNGVTSKIKSIALSLLVFNWITKGFNAMVSGMKDGFKNLVQYSDEYNRSISSLQSANLQLKNSFAAAFAPIVQMVIPYLVQLIGYVTTAMNTLAQFIAILSGAATWTRASKVQQNYAASLKGTAAAAKKAAGALASFDEIEVLSKKDSSGGGSGGIDPGQMFEEIPVDPKLKEWLDSILNKLKPLLEYLKQLGGLFMDGFRDGLGDYEYRLDIIKEGLQKIKDALINIWTDPAVLEAAQAYVESLVYMLGSLSGSIVSIALTLAAAFIGGLGDYMEKNVDRIKDYIISMFNIGTEINNLLSSLFQSIAYIFEAFASESGIRFVSAFIGIIADTFMGQTELLLKLGRDILEIIITPITENEEEFRTALEGLLSAGAEALEGFKQMVDSVFDNLNKVYDEHFKPFFDSIAQGLSTIVNSFLNVWNEHVSPILQEIGSRLNDLFSQYLSPFINSVVELLGNLVTVLKGLWEDIVVPFIDLLVTYVFPIISDYFDVLITAIISGIEILLEVFTGLIDFINFLVEQWNLNWEAAQVIFDGFWNYMKKAFNTLKDLATGFLETIKLLIDKDWKGAWENAKKIFTTFKENVKGVISSIKDFLQTFFDWVASMVEICITKIKAIGESIGQGIGGFFGGGTSISKQSIDGSQVRAVQDIPHLATGSVIRGGNPFMAVLGDQKFGQTNIEAPLSTIEDAVRNVMADNSYSGGDATINLNYDGETFARLFLPDFFAEAHRQGYDFDFQPE